MHLMDDAFSGCWLMLTLHIIVSQKKLQLLGLIFLCDEIIVVGPLHWHFHLITIIRLSFQRLFDVVWWRCFDIFKFATL